MRSLLGPRTAQACLVRGMQRQYHDVVKWEACGTPCLLREADLAQKAYRPCHPLPPSILPPLWPSGPPSLLLIVITGDFASTLSIQWL